ncbi:MAG: HAMP domain-containing sensor histidine kinase [Pseudomonadota bacterium]
MIQEVSLASRTVDANPSENALEVLAAAISHDVRAPLRHLVAFSGFLQDQTKGSLSDDVEEYVRIINESAENLANMADTLVDFARLDQTFDRNGGVNIARCVEDAHRGLVGEAGADDLVLTLSCDYTITADATLLTRLCREIIDNAIKFRHRDNMSTLDVTHALHGDLIELSFIDNGKGFTNGSDDRVFKLFQKGHTDTTLGGAGAGLAICRRICDLHGGAIEMDQSHEQGARIVVILPVNGDPT